MANRTDSDDEIAKDKRAQKSKNVTINFIDQSKLLFEVLDEKGFIKYRGKLDEKGNYHNCTCDSFYYGMKFTKGIDDKEESQYQNENGHSFGCKHIMKALEKRSE